MSTVTQTTKIFLIRVMKTNKNSFAQRTAFIYTAVQVLLTAIDGKFHLITSYLSKTSKYLNNCRIILTLHGLFTANNKATNLHSLLCFNDLISQELSQKKQLAQNYLKINASSIGKIFSGKVKHLQAKVSHIAYLAVQSACLRYLFCDMLDSTTCIFSW